MGCTTSYPVKEDLPIATVVSKSSKDDALSKTESDISFNINDKNIFDENGDTALICTIKNGMENIALVMLKDIKKYHIGEINKDGNTALILAINKEMEKVALKLLEHPELCNMGQKIVMVIPL